MIGENEMNINTKCHFVALTELIELISVGGVLAIIADILWVLLDSNEAHWQRIGLYFVLLGLCTALCISGFALIRYHLNNVKKLLHEKFLHKLYMNKYKLRHKHEL